MTPRTHHHHRTVAGLDVFYREAGDPDRPTLVLLHGAPASSYMFRDLIPLLADSFHVIAPDYIGFGLSDAPSVTEFDYTFDRLTDITEGLLQALGVKSFALYVQDYGAPVGWRLFLRDPARVTAIISQNGNAYEEGFVDGFWAPLWRYAQDRNPQDELTLLSSLTLEKIQWQYTHGVDDPTVVSPDAWLHDIAQVNRPGNPAIQLALYADYPTNRTLYPQLHHAFRRTPVPLLAIWGRNDEIFGPDGARAFTRDLPDAQIVLLDGGHFLLESRLHEVADHIHTFLAAHGPVRAEVATHSAAERRPPRVSDLLRQQHGAWATPPMRTVVNLATADNLFVEQDSHIIGALRGGATVAAGRTLLIDGLISGVLSLAAGAKVSVRGQFSAEIDRNDGDLHLDGYVLTPKNGMVGAVTVSESSLLDHHESESPN